MTPTETDALKNNAATPAAPVDKSGVVHNTPLKPGMELAAMQRVLENSDNSSEAKALKKRIADVVIVHDTPLPERPFIVIAALKAGGFGLLYLGSDAAAADKAAVFNPDEHKRIVIYRNPTSIASYNAVRTPVVHNTPLPPGAEHDYRRMLGKAAEVTGPLSPPMNSLSQQTQAAQLRADRVPLDFVESEEARRLAAGELGTSPQCVIDEVNARRRDAMGTRYHDLSELKNDELRAAATTAGVSLDGVPESLTNEEEEVLIELILAAEFPESQGSKPLPDPAVPTGGPSDKKPKGLGKQ